MTIDPSRTLADLVVERPARGRVLERLGLDYCCGGRRSLEEASRERGLDAKTVVAFLESEPAVSAVESRDWASEPLADLCAHIVDVHHGRLRWELPRLTELAERAAHVHGDDDPALRDVECVLAELRRELDEHMDDEEAHLFPALVGGGKPGPDELARLEHEHADTGAALQRLRELTRGYDRAAARCSTHRALLDGLHGLELDVHQHVHEENNVLFPRARALAA
ncbi:MAG TPA: DUF542 domain-containing protein [Gaiellaceae bacterium]